MKKIILLAIATAILVSTIFSQENVRTVSSQPLTASKNSTQKSCNVSGYILDKDPNGLNVRAAPDKSGKILSRLVKGKSEITLDVVGTAGNGWLKITNAWHDDDGDVFKGFGWVFATKLATGTKGYPNYDLPVKLYLSANKKSRILTQIPGEAEVTILDCAGDWAKVSYEGTKNGWLAPEN